MRLWPVRGWWMLVGGGWGVPPHMCTCKCMHTHAHACVINMIISCKWLPTLGKSLGIPYDVIYMCARVHVHACLHMWGHPVTTPTPIQPPTPTPIHPTTLHPHTPIHPPPPYTHPPPGGCPKSVKIQ